MFWHVYVKIPRVASQNPIAKGDFHWILARNCEDTEQLRAVISEHMGDIFRVAVLAPAKLSLHIFGKFQRIVLGITAVIGESPGSVGISIIVGL